MEHKPPALDSDTSAPESGDHEWILLKADKPSTLRSPEVVLTLRKLEETLKPLGVVMKDWGKPGAT